jgi:hypothetical protein
MQGQVVPDYFTHGTSAQRTRWFRMGIARDSFETRDTYFAKTLLSTRTGLDTRPAQSTITSWSNPCPDDSTVNAFC